MQEHEGDLPEVEGFAHIERAAELLKDVVDDLFDLPTAAQDRAIEQRELLGEDHGDDLDCGCWSSAQTATAILQLAGRHMDAVVHLAAAHPGFAPSAAVLSRSALESLLRVRWLVDPPAAIDREQRWIALRREEVRFYKNSGAIDPAVADDDLVWLDGLSSHLGGTPVARTPSVETLARDFQKTTKLYDLFYRWNSQPTHGTLVGAGTFSSSARQEWYAQGGRGEWIEAEFWGMPLIACWEGAEIALPAYRDLLVPTHPLPSLEAKTDFGKALRSVPPNYQAVLSAKAERATAPEKPQAPALAPKPHLNRAQRRALKKRHRGA